MLRSNSAKAPVKREPYSVHEPIPNEYWFTNRFEWFDLLKGKPSASQRMTLLKAIVIHL